MQGHFAYVGASFDTLSELINGGNLVETDTKNREISDNLYDYWHQKIEGKTHGTEPFYIHSSFGKISANAIIIGGSELFELSIVNQNIEYTIVLGGRHSWVYHITKFERRKKIDSNEDSVYDTRTLEFVKLST